MFKKGDYVRFNNSKREQILERRTKMISEGYTLKNIGELPTYKLLVINGPYKKNNNVLYDYAYGMCFSSEGSAKEEDLEVWKD